MSQSSQSADLPRAERPGEVVQAPIYIRVRPGWLEKALFLAVFLQIMLVGFLLSYGSTPARDARDAAKVNTELLCERIKDVSPDLYPKYAYHCPAQ